MPCRILSAVLLADCRRRSILCYSWSLYVPLPSYLLVFEQLTTYVSVVTTAVFSTCGMGIIVFSIAAILSLPKQLITVYLGVIIKESGDGTETKQSTYISDSVLVVSFIVTIAAAYWIQVQMNKAKPEVLRERRRAKAQKEWETYGGRGPSRVYDGSSSTDRLNASGADIDSESVFNPADSDEGGLGGYGAHGGARAPGLYEYASAPVSVKPQRWDSSGRAIPLLYDQADDRARKDSADVVGWDATGGREPTYGGNVPGFQNEGRRESPRAQQQREPTYPPPGGQSYPPGTSHLPYTTPYDPTPTIPPPPSSSQQEYPPPSNYPSQQQASYPPSSFTSSPQVQHPAVLQPRSGESTPYFTPLPSQPPSLPSLSQPQSRPQSPPQASQPAISPSVPRYQLHDGPARSIMSDAPSYRTQDQIQAELDPRTPRIPPPPQS